MDRYQAHQESINSNSIECRVTEVAYFRNDDFVAFLLESDQKGNIPLMLEKEEDLNRALFGDLVNYDPETEQVISIKEPYDPDIIGILQANSRITFGTNKRGSPLYLVKTFNSKYPNFVVPYDKRKRGSRNQYVIIKRNIWPNTAKRPIGKIREYLGLAGNMNIEIQAILTRYDLPRHNITKRQLHHELPPKENKNRVDLTDQFLFSVDPEGCEDIDDALHFEILGENKFRVGVHIADPASYLPIGSIHDQLARDRLTSVYPPDNQRIDMLYPELAIETISLKKDQTRLANSVLFTIEGNQIINIKLVQSIVKVKENFSYEEMDLLLDQKEPNDYQKFLGMTKSVGKRYLSKFRDMNITSHEMIEIWMLLTNSEIGKILVKKYGSRAPIRVFQKPNEAREEPKEKSKWDPDFVFGSYLEYSQRPEELSDELRRMMRIRNYQAAYYRLHSDKKIYNQHEELGLEDYTHFTSPIRRYFDLVVHRMLFDGYQEPNLENLLRKIDNRNQNVRKAERYFNLLKIVYHQDDEITEEDMVLVGWDDPNLELWSERWKIFIKYKLVPRMLRVRFGLESDGTFFSVEGEYQELYKFKKFQKVKIRSILNPQASHFKDKILFEMIEPNLDLTKL